MENRFELSLDGQKIRFTRAGKVAVIDAIKALVGSDANATRVWNRIREQDPSLINDCERHRFRDGDTAPVMGVEGWNKVIEIITSQPIIE